MEFLKRHLLESFDPFVLFLYGSKMSNWFFIYLHKCKQTKVTDFLKFFQAMLEFNNYKSMWIIIYTDFEVQTIRNSKRLEVKNIGTKLSSIIQTLICLTVWCSETSSIKPLDTRSMLPRKIAVCTRSILENLNTRICLILGDLIKLIILWNIRSIFKLSSTIYARKWYS